MAKRMETKIIERVLLEACFGSNPKLAKEYGASEVSIDFARNGVKKELVDFMSYDAKADIFRCYEIKVTMSDFRSKAKLSWYGNYNYLVLSAALYRHQSLEEWKKQIPEPVGIIVVDTDAFSPVKESVKKASMQKITQEQNDALKKSLIRTLFYEQWEVQRYWKSMQDNRL